MLALTGYRAPDLLGTFYERRGLGVVTGESRSRIVGRRSFGTKGDRAGGGGGFLEGADQLRTDFRAVAVWRGDLETDASGDASVRFVLPDSLTTYRLMAVAVAGDEEFGRAESEFRATKPLGLEPAMPRFLRPGDRAQSGVVVRNRTKERRSVRVRAVVSGAAVRVSSPAEQVVSLDAGGSAEARFDWTGVSPGESRLRFDAASDGVPPETDAFEVPLPVRTVTPVETVATFFSTDGRAQERVAVPPEAFPETGGLEVRVAPTALVQAADRVESLVAYPHRCAEQIASRLLGVLAAARLGPGFAPDEVEGVARTRWVEATARSLSAFQHPTGGFAYWQDSREPDEALTAHVTWALAEARRSGVAVSAETTDRAALYLSQLLRKDRWAWGEHDGWTVKVLASFALERLGKAEPGYYQGLHDSRSEGRPLWAEAILAATMLGSNATDPRGKVLVQEVRNGLVVEARSAALRESAPEWGWRFWWSDRRGSAAALIALLASDGADPVSERLARGLLEEGGSEPVDSTQDAAWALQALALYRERHEGEVAAGEVAIRLGRDPLLRAVFQSGQAPRTESARVSMQDLKKRAGRDGVVRLEATIEGRGLVHVAALLSYASRATDRPAVAQGMSLRTRFLDGKGREIAGARAAEAVSIEVALAATADLRFVAIEVPIPAGLETVDAQLATTARPDEVDEPSEAESEWDAAPGFDHVEMRDDRVVLYATSLPAGSHTTKVPCRATTTGRFVVAPAHAEEMYTPEVFATTPASVFEVGP